MALLVSMGGELKLMVEVVNRVRKRVMISASELGSGWAREEGEEDGVGRDGGRREGSRLGAEGGSPMQRGRPCAVYLSFCLTRIVS